MYTSDEGSQIEVAVKKTQAIIEEAMCLDLLRHRNIVKFYGGAISLRDMHFPRVTVRVSALALYNAFGVNIIAVQVQQCVLMAESRGTRPCLAMLPWDATFVCSRVCMGAHVNWCVNAMLAMAACARPAASCLPRVLSVT